MKQLSNESNWAEQRDKNTGTIFLFLVNFIIVHVVPYDKSSFIYEHVIKNPMLKWDDYNYFFWEKGIWRKVNNKSLNKLSVNFNDLVLDSSHRYIHRSAYHHHFNWYIGHDHHDHLGELSLAPGKEVCVGFPARVVVVLLVSVSCHSKPSIILWLLWHGDSHDWPIRGQYPGHLTPLDQSEASTQVTWSLLTNIRGQYPSHVITLDQSKASWPLSTNQRPVPKSHDCFWPIRVQYP